MWIYSYLKMKLNLKRKYFQLQQRIIKPSAGLFWAQDAVWPHTLSVHETDLGPNFLRREYMLCWSSEALNKLCVGAETQQG